MDAPAEQVWRWLVQIGQDRGGFYSYDWLENLAGCRLRSAEEVHEEWQHRQAGDPLAIFPGYATRLTEVDPPHALVIEDWGAYVVVPVDDASCRLLARSRAHRDVSGVAYVLLIELPHAIMERKMLLGIKKRAEQHGTGVPDGPARRSVRRCRIGVGVFVVGVSGTHEGRPHEGDDPRCSTWFP